MLLEFFQTRNSKEAYIDSVVDQLRADYCISGMPTTNQLRQIALDSGIKEVYHTPAAIALDGANVVTSDETGYRHIITLPFRARGLTEFFTSHEVGHEVLEHGSEKKPEYERQANYFARQLTRIHPSRAVAQAMPEILLILFYDMPKFLFNKGEQEKLRNL